jgi:hypothetical protein
MFSPRGAAYSMTIIDHLAPLARRHTVPAFITLILTLIVFGNSTYSLPCLLGYCGGFILALYWLIRLIIHLVRHRHGRLSAEEKKVAVLRWCIEPCSLALLILALPKSVYDTPLKIWPVFGIEAVLLLTCAIRGFLRMRRGRFWSAGIPMEFRAFLLVAICCFTCSKFILQFALSYRSLTRYVRASATDAPFHLSPDRIAAYYRAHSPPALAPTLPAPTDQWFVNDSPKSRAGLFAVGESVTSRGGDVLLFTGFGSEFISDDVGIYYTVDHQLLEYHDVVEPAGSFQMGERSQYTHIFGPWYFWQE